MTKKPFREQLSKFSLLGQLPKVETGLEEAWENLKKCTEPFTAQDIIKRQQETINRQKAEIERLQKLLDDKCDRCIAKERAATVKEVVNRLQKLIISQLGCSTMEKKEAYYFCLDEIDNIEKEMVGEQRKEDEGK